MGNKLGKNTKNDKNGTKENIDVEPERCTGYIHKQGHRFKTWKLRYFVLDHGKLEYFADDDKNSGKGVKPKGLLVISEYIICEPNHIAPDLITSTMLYMKREDGKEPDLMLNFQNDNEKLKWAKLIQAHAKYYKDVKGSIQCWCRRPFANRASAACDAEDCPIGWFHLKCVNLTPKHFDDEAFEFYCYGCRPKENTICVCQTHVKQLKPNIALIKCKMGKMCPIGKFHRYGCLNIPTGIKESEWMCPWCEGRFLHGDQGALLRIKSK